MGHHFRLSPRHLRRRVMDKKNVNVIPIPTTPAIPANTNALTGKESVMKKSYAEVDLRPIADAKYLVYQAQEAIVHELLGTTTPTLRQVNTLLNKLEAMLDSLRTGQEEDLGWAWGENYNRDIAKLETIVEAAKAVHAPWFAANSGVFEDEVWTTCQLCNNDFLTDDTTATYCGKCKSGNGPTGPVPEPAFADDEIPF